VLRRNDLKGSSSNDTRSHKLMNSYIDHLYGSEESGKGVQYVPEESLTTLIQDAFWRGDGETANR